MFNNVMFFGFNRWIQDCRTPTDQLEYSSLQHSKLVLGQHDRLLKLGGKKMSGKKPKWPAYQDFTERINLA